MKRYALLLVCFVSLSSMAGVVKSGIKTYQNVNQKKEQADQKAETIQELKDGTYLDTKVDNAKKNVTEKVTNAVDNTKDFVAHPVSHKANNAVENQTDKAKQKGKDSVNKWLND